MKDNMDKTASILVIEDDPMMIQLLKRTLELDGYHVRAAADGVYGMTLLRDNRPDLVLLDIMMPGPDGYQVLESIRQCCNVPVIMVTANREVDSVKKALDLGADDYIGKPFRPSELTARVRAKLRRSELEVVAA
jgi:DNA-binding response OmpR family regulator